MTQKEIKDKIADWENRLKNPSVAGVPSAVTKINSEIAQLEAMLEKDDNIVTDKATIQKIKNSINEGELILKSGKSNGRKMSESELEAVLNSVNKGRAKIGMPEFEKPKEEKKEKVSKEPKKEKSEKEKQETKETKAEPKKDAYDCDELVKEAKERHAKAKAAAEARANAPKKSEATKDKEKIEKVHETVEKQLEKGKLTKSQLEKLIAETKDLLKLLEKALKDL